MDRLKRIALVSLLLNPCPFIKTRTCPGAPATCSHWHAPTLTSWSIALYVASTGPVPMPTPTRSIPSGPRICTVAVGMPMVPHTTCAGGGLGSFSGGSPTRYRPPAAGCGRLPSAAALGGGGCGEEGRGGWAGRRGGSAWCDEGRRVVATTVLGKLRAGCGAGTAVARHRRSRLARP
eukprot:86396-Chlamydomonas_euryale.AAC.11